MALLIVGALGAVAAQPAGQIAAALESMADAERAFARTGLQKGIRDAFVAFFADDSIGFYPTTMNALEFYKNQPPTPLTRRLEWEPRTGDIARSGELGWLTGPYTSRNTETKAPPTYGCYFSIWRKQPDGAWKVLMDVGINTPAAATFPAGFAAVTEPNGRYVAPSGASRPSSDVVMALDRDLSDAVRRQGLTAYDRVLNAASRLHVPGFQPLVGREAIASRLAASKGTAAFVPEAGTVAASADLGFTRGSYELIGAGGSDASEKGYYVRIWKRGADDRWLLGVEVRSPLPAPKR